MTKPHEGFMPPGLPGQTKTMFYTEGNPAAALVVNRAGRRSVKTMTFLQAEGALAWCRQNATVLVYCPVNLEGN